jgi:hypothetical protein
MEGEVSGFQVWTESDAPRHGCNCNSHFSESSNRMLKVHDENVSDSSQTVIVSPAKRTGVTGETEIIPKKPCKIRKIAEMR